MSHYLNFEFFDASIFLKHSTYTHRHETNKTRSAVSLKGLGNIKCCDHGPQVKMALMKYSRLFSVLLHIKLCSFKMK